MDFPLAVTAHITPPAPPKGRLTSSHFPNVKWDGTNILIDGHIVRGVKNFDIRSGVGEPVTMTLELYVNLLP